MRTRSSLRSALSAGLLIVLAGACSEDTSGTNVSTGVRLLIRWDSSLEVARFSVSAQTTGGATAVGPIAIDAPISLEPPGPRTHLALVDLRSAPPGQEIRLRTDGLDSDGLVIGTGTAQMTVLPNQLVDASLRLVAPTNNPPPPPIDCRAMPNLPECMNPPPPVPPPTPPPLLGPHVYQVEVKEELTTVSTEFVDVPGATLTFTPNAATEDWLIFVSGLMASSDPSEVAAELRVLINGVEVDHFGHQTRGATENSAGFLTFSRITGSAELQTISVQFRSVIGTTSASNLRLLAALVPPNGDVHFAETLAAQEKIGSRVELQSLSFTPSRAGEYLVLGRVTEWEAPGGDTVQSWIENDDTHVMRPLDERGAHYSNGRDSLAPMFSAFRTQLDGSRASFSMRGTSSAVTGAAAAWWDPAYAFRRAINVTGPTAIEPPADYAVSFVFDHATLAADGRSLSTGDDVRVVAVTGAGEIELDRIVDPSSSWGSPTTTIWFKTPPPDVNGVIPTYAVYYGNPAAEAPPADGQNIFLFYEDFPGNTLDPQKWTVLRGLPNVAPGRLLLAPDTAISGERLAFGGDTRWEASLSLSVDPSSGFSYWAAGTGENVGQDFIGFLTRDAGHWVSSAGLPQQVQIDTPTATHVYAFDRLGAAVRYYQDGRLLTEQARILADLQVPIHVDNATTQGTITYNWMRVRSISEQEPVLAVAVEEGLGGALASTWSHARLVAFRADAWAAFNYAESPGISAGATAEVTVKSTVTTERPPEPTNYLVIQSIRISGESSDVARKSGVLSMNEQVVLASSHKMNRGNGTINGYHHNAAVAYYVRAEAPLKFDNGFASPDLINVEAADSVIIVLRYPPLRP